jgi:hypothetical protein
MPVYLNTMDNHSELSKFRSVLIVPCRICPSISLAVAHGEPYIEFFRRFLSTAAFQRTITSMRAGLEGEGVRTAVFQSDIPIPMICMWSSWQRNRLLKRAGKFGAAVVLGCDAATRTVEDVVSDTNCRVFPGMAVEGIVRVTPKFHLPCNITLEIASDQCVAWPDSSVAKTPTDDWRERESVRPSE